MKLKTIINKLKELLPSISTKHNNTEDTQYNKSQQQYVRDFNGNIYKYGKDDENESYPVPFKRYVLYTCLSLLLWYIMAKIFKL